MPRAGPSRSLPVLAVGVAAVLAVAGVTRWLNEVDITSDSVASLASRVGTDFVRFTFVLTIVVGIISLVALITGGDPRGAQVGDPRQRRPVHTVVSVLMAVALVVGFVVLVRHVVAHPDSGHRQAIPPGPTRSFGRVTVSHGSITGDWLIVLVLVAVTVTVAGVALMIWTRPSPRPSSGEGAPVLDDVPAVPDGADPASHLDPRQAVLAAYQRLLAAFGARGMGRRASEAPFEHLDRVLGGTAAVVPAHSVARAFEIARFSDHEITRRRPRRDARRAAGRARSARRARGMSARRPWIRAVVALLPAGFAALVRAPVAVVALLAIAGVLFVAVRVVSELAGDRRIARPERLFEMAMRRRPPTPVRKPRDLESIQTTVAAQSRTAAGVHYWLRPLVSDVAAARLSAGAGVALDDPRAASLVPRPLWDLIRPERPAPEDRLAPGLTPRQLALVLDQLEAL